MRIQGTQILKNKTIAPHNFLNAKNMTKKKLEPVSEELVNKIINEGANSASYGCGSGSGCGCGCGSGSGCGCGCGCGSGSGSGDDTHNESITYYFPNQTIYNFDQGTNLTITGRVYCSCILTSSSLLSVSEFNFNFFVTGEYENKSLHYGAAILGSNLTNSSSIDQKVPVQIGSGINTKTIYLHFTATAVVSYNSTTNKPEANGSMCVSVEKN